MSKQIFLILFLLNTVPLFSMGSIKKRISKNNNNASSGQSRHSVNLKDKITSKSASSTLISDTIKKGDHIKDVMKLPIHKSNKQKKKDSLKSKRINESKTPSERAVDLLRSQARKETIRTRKSSGTTAAAAAEPAKNVSKQSESRQFRRIVQEAQNANIQQLHNAIAQGNIDQAERVLVGNHLAIQMNLQEEEDDSDDLAPQVIQRNQ